MEFSFLAKSPFEKIQSFFLVERDGEKDRFHRVVAALICGCLRVAASAAKKAVKMFLIFAPQRTAELQPTRRDLFNEFPKCRDCPAHI